MTGVRRDTARLGANLASAAAVWYDAAAYARDRAGDGAAVPALVE